MTKENNINSLSKILHIISSGGFFGVENVLLNLSRVLKDRKFEVVIMNLSNKDIHTNEVLKEAIKFGIKTESIYCPGRLDFKVIKKLRAYIKMNSINIIHSHEYKSNFYAFFSSLFLNVKKVSTVHNWIRNNFKLILYSLLDKYVLRGFNNVIAVSDNVKNELIASGIKQSKVTLIANGIDVKKFNLYDNHSILKKRFNINDSEKIIGTLGRLSQEKGHIYLLYAFAEINKKFPNIKLLIIGDGPLRKKLEQLSSSLDLKENVIFTGSVSEVQNILSIIDVFVLPSLVEAMPLALLEAMASKRPTIATRVGDIPRIIKNGTTGLLINPGKPKEISCAVENLLTNTNLSEQLAKNAFEFVRIFFSLEQMASKYISIYNLS